MNRNSTDPSNSCVTIDATVARMCASSLRTGVSTLTSTMAPIQSADTAGFSNRRTRTADATLVHAGEPADRAEHPCQTVSMNAPQSADGVGASWLSPSVDEQGLARYATTLRERKWLIVATVLVTTLAAIVYLATATKVYEAEADILITPVDSSPPVPSSPGLIHDPSDPTRDVETASR